MAAFDTQRLFLTLLISVCSAWAEGEGLKKPACNCPQGNGYNFPHYGYQFPQYGYNTPKHGDNVPNPTSGHADKENSNDGMYSPPGVFMAHPYMYIMPQWPHPYGPTLKGEKGEPGISVNPSPNQLNEGEPILPQDIVERLTQEYLDKHTQGLKGEKGDPGITGPPGFKGEAGPQGPSGRPGTMTRLKPLSWESQHEKRSLTDNIQGDDQFGHARKATDSRVAFTVAMDKNVGPASDPVVLKFNDVTTNLGEGYNTETGQFVAPAPGLYVFSYHILAQHSKPMEVALHHNDKTINSVHSRQTGGYTGVSNSAVLALEKGDVITLVLSPGIYSVYGESGHHTTFTGYLLYPD